MVIVGTRGLGGDDRACTGLRLLHLEQGSRGFLEGHFLRGAFITAQAQRIMSRRT